jgi:DNA-nicking Smr family endonuclease
MEETKDADHGGKTEDEVEIPIDGVLDLHTFNPRDVKELLPEYIAACRRKGIFEIRMIHGKGTGALRETVHSILRRLPGIASFRTAGEDAGGWGATLVTLDPDERKAS